LAPIGLKALSAACVAKVLCAGLQFALFIAAAKTELTGPTLIKYILFISLIRQIYID
jgi:hypothetical protein